MEPSNNSLDNQKPGLYLQKWQRTQLKRSEFPEVSAKEFLKRLGVPQEEAERICQSALNPEGLNTLEDIAEYVEAFGHFGPYLPAAVAARATLYLKPYFQGPESDDLRQRKQNEQIESPPRLEKVTLKGIYSFLEETTFEFKENCLFLVGPNGGGKTNFARAVALSLDCFRNKQRFGLEWAKHLEASDTKVTLHFAIPEQIRADLIKLLKDLLYVFHCKVNDTIEAFEEIHTFKVVVDWTAQSGYILFQNKTNEDIIGVEKKNQFYIPYYKGTKLKADNPYKLAKDYWSSHNQADDPQPAFENKMEAFLENAIRLHSTSPSLSRYEQQISWTMTNITTQAMDSALHNPNSEQLNSANNDLEYLLGWRFHVKLSYYDFARWLLTYKLDETKITALHASNTADQTLLVIVKFIQQRTVDSDNLTSILRAHTTSAKLLSSHLGVELSSPEARESTVYFRKKGSTQDIPIQCISGGVRDVFSLLYCVHSSSSGTLILDEPGASLHPTKRAQLLHILLKNNKHNLVVITHAPEFLSLMMLPFTYHCRFARNQTIARRVIELIDKRKEQSLLLDPSLRPLLFAEKVAFVEGNTDELIMQALVASFEEDFTKAFDIATYTIIRLSGSGNATVMSQCAEAFGVIWIAIGDVDVIKNKQSNYEVEKKDSIVKFISRRLQSLAKNKKQSEEEKSEAKEKLTTAQQTLVELKKGSNNYGETLDQVIDSLPIDKAAADTLKNYKQPTSIDESKINISDFVHDEALLETEAGRRKACLENGIFIFQEDPEFVIRKNPSIAKQFYEAIYPGKLITHEEAVHWAKPKNNEAVKYALGPRLHDIWRAIPFQAVVNGMKHLRENDEEMKALVEFLSNPKSNKVTLLDFVEPSADNIKVPLLIHEKLLHPTEKPIEIPQKIRDALDAKNLQLDSVDGDGNCQFSAAAKMISQLKGKQYTAKKMRELAITWLRQHKHTFLEGIELQSLMEDRFETWEDYLEHLSKDRTWGDYITLMAISSIFKVKIILVSDAAHNDIEFNSHYDNEIVFSYIDNLHYDATKPL